MLEPSNTKIDHMNLKSLHNWIFFKVVIVLLLSTSSPFLIGQSMTDPLQQVEFYTVDALPIDQTFNQPAFKSFYNKLYDEKAFLKSYFSVWNVSANELIKEVAKGALFQTQFEVEKRLKDRNCFKGNFSGYSDAFIQLLQENTAFQSFPNRASSWGVVTNSTNIRDLPTQEYCLRDVRGAGEGYPFDYHQQSSLWVGNPVRILHESKDGRWYYIASPYSYGWVKKQDIATLTQKQMSQWQAGTFVVVTKDHLTLGTDNDPVEGRVGMLLPSSKSRDFSQVTLGLPRRLLNGKMKLQKVVAPAGAVAKYPIPFSANHVKSLFQQLLGSKYSWGGIDGGRDCSSTLKDFFTPFGIWLPRNSSQQRNAGKVIALQGSKQEKTEKILLEGIPFLSIIYKRGHSMLYVGQNDKGDPLIFHNVWGIKPIFKNDNLKMLAKEKENYGIFGLSEKKEGIAGRYIIGQAVITSVDPEANFETLDFDGFIENIQSIALIPLKQ